MNENFRKRITLIAMCISTFVAILDTTVVNLALHSIQMDLHATLSELQWTMDVYNLTYASMILNGGVLGDLFGRRRFFVIGVLLFAAGSWTPDDVGPSDRHRANR